MKYTIGLDIGTNSIGWVLMSDNNIVDKGVVIFPIGTNLIKGVQEETKNHQRGGYRRTKRNLFRYKLRRKDLKQFLKGINMIPDFKKTFEIENDYQASELYKIRAQAINQQIPIEEIGRIFLLINKHRGFKSNSKTLVEKNEKENEEDGKVKEGISQLTHFMINNGAKTIGDYFHKMYLKAEELYKQGQWHNIDEPYDERAENKDGIFILQNNRGIRRENGRYVSRAMYEQEFDLIWEQQKKHYPQLTGSRKEYDEILKLPISEKREELKKFKETLYWKIRFTTIFYQRQLKSQKKFIGKCQFETNKRTAPISSLLFQEFRILKQLADVRYSDKKNEINNQPLPNEWQEKIISYLNTHSKLNLREGKKNKDGIKNMDVMDILEITNKKDYEFNFDTAEDDKTFEGNKTLYAIYKACGEKTFNELQNNSYKYLELKNKNANQLEALWHILYMAKDDDWLKDTLLFTWGFDETTSNNLIEMGLEDGFANYSSKVLQKIIPFMKKGKDEYEALVMTDYLKGIDEEKEVIKLSKKIKQLKNNELRNPVVEKAVSQTIKLVNAIIENKEYNINQEELTIHIESTREFKKPKTEREKIRRGNTDIDKKRND
jgi:CRISPR-associated endonuclease Csn1